MDDFSKTRRGTKFFDLDLPKIASQLERIAEAMERKNILEEKRFLFEQKRFVKENRTKGATDSQENKLDESLDLN